MKWDIDFGDRPWGRWFAWYPVRIGNQRAWLEYVEREVENVQGWRIARYRWPDATDALLSPREGTQLLEDQELTDDLARRDTHTLPEGQPAASTDRGTP